MSASAEKKHTIKKNLYKSSAARAKCQVMLVVKMSHHTAFHAKPGSFKKYPNLITAFL